MSNEIGTRTRSAATLVWEPPAGPARAAGGLLGAVGGEAWRPPLGRIEPAEPAGPVAQALLGICHNYVTYRGACVPVDVAKRHLGVAGPAWLLGVAIVRPDVPAIVADALELATAAGIPRHALGHCMTYVEVAAGLFAGRPADEAIAAATAEQLPAPGSALPLCGDAIVDGLSVGIWALYQPDPIVTTLSRLADSTTPAVRASAAGLLGLRDGLDALPAHWPRASSHAAESVAVAPALVRARHRHRADPQSSGAPR